MVQKHSATGRQAARGATGQATMGIRPLDLIKMIRPRQWLKSGFVFLGIIFSGDWQQPAVLWRVILAAFAFSLVSSAIYIQNDLRDREADAHHPVKRLRPIAAGRISTSVAVSVMLVLLLLGLAIGWSVSAINALLLLLYLVQNIAYSRGLKRVVLLDVFIIALGFMLRILSGTLGVGIEPSKWLLLCGLMLTLFIGFGKRWAELDADVASVTDFRPVLGNYSREMLNQYTGICAGGAILTYALYTLDPATVALQQTDNLIYTVPLVIYGIFRYFYLLHTGQGGDPSKLVVKDAHIVVTVLLWLVAVILILN